MNKRVLFYQVTQPKSKIDRLVQVAGDHFERKSPLMIFVQDEKTAEFVDNILWSEPKKGFLPHAVSNERSTERVTISTSLKNLNEATSVFNLTKNPLQLEGSLTKLYEFEDLLKPDESKQRYHLYKELGYSIATL